MSNEIEPSYFVQQTRIYTRWCSITICPICHAVGKYEDAHPVNPCQMCGEARPEEAVGKWVWDCVPWWKFTRKHKGRWILKGGDNV